MSNREALPRRQQQLHDLLFGKGDVPIADLYAVMRESEDADPTTQDQQRWLGPYITALNRKLADRSPPMKVEPGERKNSYRLVIQQT